MCIMYVSLYACILFKIELIIQVKNLLFVSLIKALKNIHYFVLTFHIFLIALRPK